MAEQPSLGRVGMHLRACLFIPWAGGPKRSVFVPFLMIGNIFTLYPWDIEIRILAGHYCLVCISMYIINYVMTFIAFAYNPKELEDFTAA